MIPPGPMRVHIEPGQPAPAGSIDWERVRTLSDAEVTAAALSGPDAQPMTPEELPRMSRPSNP